MNDPTPVAAYIAYRRIRVTPNTTNSAASMSSAHSDSVGMDAGASVTVKVATAAVGLLP